MLRALALVYVMVQAWVASFGPPSAEGFPPYRIDIDVYRLGGLALMNGESLYDKVFVTEVGYPLPFTYPPFAAHLFTAFARVSLPYATGVIAVVSCAALFGVVWLSVREVTKLRGRGLFWATIGALVPIVTLAPFRETMGFGQVNVLIMALVLADLTLGRDRWWRGALIGLAVAIKVTPLAFGLFFLMRWDVRGGVQTLASFGLWTGIAHLLSPGDSTIYWTQTLINSDRIGAPHYAANQSITGLLARSELPDDTQRAIWLGCVVILALLIAAMMWLLIRRGEFFAAILANAVFGLLASPVSWSHHWVWIISVLIWLAANLLGPRTSPASAPRRPGWLLAVFLVLGLWGWWVFETAPYFEVPFGDGRELEWTGFETFFANMPIWWAIVLTGVLGAVALTAPARVARAAAGPSADGTDVAAVGDEAVSEGRAGAGDDEAAPGEKPAGDTEDDDGDRPAPRAATDPAPPAR